MREFSAPSTKNPNSFAIMCKGLCAVSQDKISPCPGCALDSQLETDVFILIIKYPQTHIKVTSQSSSCWGTLLLGGEMFPQGGGGYLWGRSSGQWDGLGNALHPVSLSSWERCSLLSPRGACRKQEYSEFCSLNLLSSWSEVCLAPSPHSCPQGPHAVPRAVWQELGGEFSLCLLSTALIAPAASCRDDFRAGFTGPWGPFHIRISCDSTIWGRGARAVPQPGIPAVDGARHRRAVVRNGRSNRTGTGARQSHKTPLQTMFINYGISTGLR